MGFSTAKTRRALKRNKVIILLVISFLIAVDFYAKIYLTRESEKIIANNLEQIIESNVAGIDGLLNAYKSDVIRITKITDIRELIEAMASLVKRKAILQAQHSPMLTALNQRMSMYTEDPKFKGYVVMLPNGTFIASDDPTFVGRQASAKGNVDIYSDERGVFVGLPRKFHSALSPDAREEVVMYVGASLYDDDGEVFAYIALRMDPKKSFSQIMTHSRYGESGETYAINQAGYLITGSRFGEQLKELGKPSEVLEIKMTNSEGKANHLMQNAFTDQSIYPHIITNTSGYEDYRGVKVVGAWTYLPHYGFTLCAEVDEVEAYKALIFIKIIFWLVLLLSIIFALSILAYSIWASVIEKKMRMVELEARELGQYRLISKLGEGAMGIVYHGEHKLLRRPTAIKVLKPEVVDEIDMKMFEKEVKMTCRLNHPNTIRIYDYGLSEEGMLYYVMEYLNGIDIDKVISSTGPMPQERALNIFLQICESLKEAHLLGLIHRDIKAQNIILTQWEGTYDFVKVLDFGLVQDLRSNDNQNDSDIIYGTPAYMSPEVLNEPDKINYRSDIYSLGVLFCYMLSGKLPFARRTKISELCHQRAHTPAKGPAELSDTPIDSELNRICLWCLQKDQNNRPTNMAQLIETLQEHKLVGSWTQKDAKKWWHEVNIESLRYGVDYFYPETNATTLTPQHISDFLNKKSE